MVLLHRGFLVVDASHREKVGQLRVRSAWVPPHGEEVVPAKLLVHHGAVSLASHRLDGDDNALEKDLVE